MAVLAEDLATASVRELVRAQASPISESCGLSPPPPVSNRAAELVCRGANKGLAQFVTNDAAWAWMLKRR